MRHCCLQRCQSRRLPFQVRFYVIVSYDPPELYWKQGFLTTFSRYFTVRYLYPLEMSLKDKIATICREMYGAVGVEYSELAEQRLAVRDLQTILWYDRLFETIVFFLTLSYFEMTTEIHCLWIWQLAHLHGQDTVFLEHWRCRQGRTHWLHCPRKRCTCRRWCRLYLSYLWWHHDRPWTTNPPWILRCWHGLGNWPRDWSFLNSPS